jgi:hypothetical protein
MCNPPAFESSITKLLDVFFPNDVRSISNLSNHLQLVAAALVEASMILALQWHDLTNSVRSILGRFPGIFLKNYHLFPVLLVFDTQMACDLYSSASAEAREQLVMGGGKASVFDFYRLTAVIPNPFKHPPLDEIIAKGIAKINEGIFDDQWNATGTFSPLATALAEVKVGFVSFLLAYGYEVRQSVDTTQVVLHKMSRNCDTVEQFDFLVSLFDPTKATAIHSAYGFRKERPERFAIVKSALQRGFSAEEGLEVMIVAEDEIEWLDLFREKVEQSGSAAHLLETAISHASGRVLKWIVERGADLYASKTLATALVKLPRSNLLHGLCDCGFDFNKVAPGDSKTYLQHMLVSAGRDAKLKLLLDRKVSIWSGLHQLLSDSGAEEMRSFLFSEPWFSQCFGCLETAVINQAPTSSQPPLLIMLVQKYPLLAPRLLCPLLKLRQDWDLLTPFQGRNFIDSLVKFVPLDVVIQEFECLLRERYPAFAPYLFASLCEVCENPLLEWRHVELLFKFVSEQLPQAISTRVRGYNAFMHAANAVRLDFVTPLAESGRFAIVDTEAGTSALICAVASSPLRSVERQATISYLLQKSNSVELNFTDSKGQSALSTAVSTWRMDSVSTLLDAGAMIPTNDTQAVFDILSSAFNSVEIVICLLERLSRDPVALARALSFVDSTGRTLLMKACFLDLGAVSKLFVESGAQVEHSSQVRRSCVHCRKLGQPNFLHAGATNQHRIDRGGEERLHGNVPVLAAAPGRSLKAGRLWHESGRLCAKPRIEREVDSRGRDCSTSFCSRTSRLRSVWQESRFISSSPEKNKKGCRIYRRTFLRSLFLC